MKNYISTEKYDVVVCGSGPAGLGAAMSAAKLGVRVILLESANLPGGIICAVPWMPINRLMLNGDVRSYAHGKFVEHVKKLGGFAYRDGPVNIIDGDGLRIHPEYAEFAIYNMLEEAGITYKMCSPVVDVIKDGCNVTGAVVYEKRGYAAYLAEAVIDATGDGDVAAAAGCEFSEGREEDGIHMPITLGFSLGGLDTDKFNAWRAQDGGKRFNEILNDAHEKGYYVPAWCSPCDSTVPGVMGFNHGAWRNQSLKSNGLDPADLTCARRNGLRLAMDMTKVFKDYNVPGTENCYVDRVANIMGTRDTRRIVGEYVQTLDDAVEDRAYPDTIARKYGHIDANQLYIGPMQSGHSYPYRSLVPKGVDGLLLAGRCASATFLGHAAGKSMGNMMELGNAAGAAAALCVKTGARPRDINIDELRHALINELGATF